jgi:rhodanese-related sulfurtransferase
MALSELRVRTGALNKESKTGRRMAFTISRLLMAGIFIYASVEKIADPVAFAKDVYNYQILPDAWINLTALVLPWLELFLGLGLLAAIWLPGAVFTLNGLLILFMAALIFNLARGLDINCGCFGSAGLGPSMSTGWYLLRDVVFLALGVFLFKAVLIDSTHLRRSAIWQTAVLVIVSAVVAITANSLRTHHLPLLGDFSAAARMTTATGERMDIPLLEARKLFASDKAVFIDARPRDEYLRAHIQGARSLPWHDVDLNFMAVTADLDFETPVITYCDGETCELSHDLALFLRDAGFLNTKVLVNGWSLWQQAGMPVETGLPPK